MTHRVGTPILSSFRPVFFISKSAEGYSSTPINQEQSMAPFRSCGNQEAGNVASEHSLCSRLYILHYQQNNEVAYCHPIPPPACENLPPAAFTQLWVSHFRRHPFSLFKRETERKDDENKWQSIIWKQK